MTSNLPFEDWTSVFGSERLTGPLLDRLTHHVHILEMNGDSCRLKQSKSLGRKLPKSIGEETLAAEIVDPDTGEITANSRRSIEPHRDGALFRVRGSSHWHGCA